MKENIFDKDFFTKLNKINMALNFRLSNGTQGGRKSKAKGVKPVIGIKIPIIGKRVETKFETISLAKADYYFDKDRNFKVTFSHIGQE